MNLRHRLYYSLRARVPQHRRLAVRRAFAQVTRWKARATWPIRPGSEVPPPDWRGWPGNARSALVLTHDVEGPRGLARVRELAELEISMGFRSAFHFVPEGSYRVPAELLAWLRANDFEVGVHDLHHDGWLFESRAAFRRNAARINAHLHAWGAGGFRAAFMLRRLGWLGDLDITHDLSTFDTDPFEPQPGGEGTIFPFLLRPGRCVELPYTLPQDSTLFLVLGETTPKIWLRKLDWVVAHGGMALVNVHPDYVAFEGEQAGPTVYPVAHYRALLERAAHIPDLWRARPRDIAAHLRPQSPGLHPQHPTNQ